uniref:Uncharacterized protein n=1 Tax=Oryza nivara TaxID=4536 RepID=A0A0E0J1V8_ORYNI
MSKCRSSHPTPQCLQWSEPHYSLDIHSTPAFGLYRTASSIGIQGADVDPNGYAEAMGNLKAQGKT